MNNAFRDIYLLSLNVQKPISYTKKIETIRRKRQREVEAKKSRENGEKRRREKERRYGGEGE